MVTSMEQLLTSKTSLIKSLLLKGWRERWTDVLWGINIKRVLPRGVSGDVYDLADCILEQALIAPTPNHLFLSYLNHCISSQMVSYGSVLASIAKYQDWSKPQCIHYLLEFLIKYKERISCHGNEEECILLSKSVVSVLSWIHLVLNQSLTKLQESKQQQTNLTQNQTNLQSLHTSDSTQFISIIEKCAEFLSFMSSSAFLKALLYVGKLEDSQTFNQFLQIQTEIESKLPMASNLLSNREPIDAIISFKQRVEWFDSSPAIVACKQLTTSIDFKSSKPTTYASLNTIIAFDAILNPASDIQVCVQQILMIAKFNDISLSDLYCEIIRSCLVGLVDASGSHEDPKHNSYLNSWAAFLFLKVPQLFAKLNSLKLSKSQFFNNNKSNDASNDLEIGLEKLLTYSPLLDLTDSKSNCDCLQCLLNELTKAELISSAKVEKIMAKRKSDTQTFRNLPRPDQQSAPQTGPLLILRAEPTVTSILKTLDSDYSKNQEALLGVLCHMQKSFELILCAAAATGKLQSFTTKLIEFNEFNKQATGESGKASQTRALLFDITFLILCTIAQHYGTDIITMNGETSNSFFATWCAHNMSEGGKYRCPDLLLSNCDPNKVDILLNQFTSTDSEFRTSLVKWHEVCMNGPQAIKEILLGWEYDSITTDNVKLILDNVKSKMCSLPVVISAWLCSYINILHHKERLKPVNMLKQFATPLATDNINLAANNNNNNNNNNTAVDAIGNNPDNGRGQPAPTAGSDQPNTYYKERSTLMANIIKKMSNDLHPQQISKSKTIPSSSSGLTVKTPLWELMESNFIAAHERSWLDLKTIYNMDTLLCVGGPQWFTDTLIKQVLKFEHLNDLNRAIDLVFGLFHMDIEQCALALITNILPNYLLNESKQEFLSEPKVSALIRLTIMTIYVALNEVQNVRKLQHKSRVGRKRHYCQEISQDLEPMDVDSTTTRTAKSMRTESDSELLENTPIYFERQTNDVDINNRLNEPIYKAIIDLLRLFTLIAADSTISQRTLVPIIFLEQLILCVKEGSYKILQLMPMNMIGCLIKTIPDSISMQFLLAVSDVQTVRSRKITARLLCQLAKAKTMS
ncbi:mediator of RNA polymerase II transcription subunit 24-like [Oppia nitens]|uniref:mediator of RNA polymerase II transcription subunit 24-like n=1 Tax=Oppia nitens TaxID=1686743 RepID=UPI0023D9F38B|nr:mediator of RNA polymerase II transcription subunit 24-like [Oppia nitens]